MKILVTGHRGYIGPHVIDILKAGGHEVTGCDLNLFRGCEWERCTEPDHEWHRNILDLTARDLEGFDGVIHLAAISNDPMGELDPDLTYRINRDGSIKLATAAKRAGVPRFLFSSSCSIYGHGADETALLDEHAPRNPLTAYAESKIAAEEAIARLSDRDFAPTYLRNATAYGHSPMLRIDLVANNLLACALARGAIEIKSDGSPWRPLVHCRDIARAFAALLEAPFDRVNNLAVNVGADDQNFQVRDVAQLVEGLVPTARIRYTGEVGRDPRDYRVSFALLSRVLPDFRLRYTLATGLEELFRKYREHRFSADDFDGDKFVRLRIMRHRLALLSPPETSRYISQSARP